MGKHQAFASSNSVTKQQLFDKNQDIWGNTQTAVMSSTKQPFSEIASVMSDHAVDIKMLLLSEYWEDVLESCGNPLPAKDNIAVHRNANADQCSMYIEMCWCWQTMTVSPTSGGATGYLLRLASFAET